MAYRLQKEIDQLKMQILALGGKVEASVMMAVRAFRERNYDLAREVRTRDLEIDSDEVDLEEECLKILALHQPVAIDLRFIVAVMKINNDLERIGDLAVNIAIRTILQRSHPEFDIPPTIFPVAGKAQEMLRDSLDALVNLEPKQARLVCYKDDEVDSLHRQTLQTIRERIQQFPQYTAQYLLTLDVSHHLERIADLATNIAEDVIYLVEGDIVRHREKLDKTGRDIR